MRMSMSGLLALKRVQARDQPHRRERGKDGQGHAFAARAGQLDRPRVAQKQAHAHLALQRLDLPAHGRLRQRHLLGRCAKIQMLTCNTRTESIETDLRR